MNNFIFLMKKKGFLYLIRDEFTGYIKIGISLNPTKRIKELQTGNSNTLTLIYTIQTEYYISLESTLHRHYKHLNIINEWFDLTITELNEIESIIQKYIISLKSLSEFDINSPLF